MSQSHSTPRASSPDPPQGGAHTGAGITPASLSVPVPHLNCPFPLMQNPGAVVADARTMEWLRHQRLDENQGRVRRMELLRSGGLAAYTTPHASPHTLQLITDWCSWFFVHDDYCDEGGIGRNPSEMKRMHARFLTIIHGAAPDESDIPLTIAFHDLWHRTSAMVSAAWQQQFTTHLDAFFQAGVWEATNRIKGEIPPLADYLLMRPHTGGMFAYLDLVEMAESLVLPPDVRRHPMVQQLNLMTANIVSWANDVLSLPKELKLGDIHNLVFSIQQAQQLSMQAAIEHAVYLHNQEVERFIEVEAALPHFSVPDDEALERYTLALRTLMRGSLEWLSTSVRYRVE